MSRTVGSGSGRKSFTNTNNSINTGTSNTVKQLDLLRTFVGDNKEYCESDLTDCLRLCGYNVERAGEMLITGEFKRSKSNNNNNKKGQKSAFFQLVNGTSSNPIKNTNAPKLINRNKQIQPKIRKSLQSKKTTATATTNNNKYSAIDLTTDEIPASQDAGETNLLSSLLLLCRRWISNALISCTRGNVQNREKLSVECTTYGKKHDPIIRFRGQNVSGRLPDSLAIIFAPILLLQQQQQQQQQQDLIRIELVSLMHDDNLHIGSTIPIEMSVYLVSPKQFFNIMMKENNQSTSTSTTKAAQFFEQKTLQKQQQQKQKISRNLTIPEAAFLILQWAEYGDVPEFKTLLEADNDNTSKNNKANDDHHNTASNDNDYDKENDDDDDNNKKKKNNNNESIEMEDDDFEIVEEEEEEDVESSNHGKVLAGSIDDASKHWSAQLPEADDPDGFMDGIALRPYQKQALYFMLQREQSGESREQLDEQLQLLRELSDAQTNKEVNKVTTLSMYTSSFSQQVQDIICDCGPVTLTENAMKNSSTLDGTINPVNHPLWKRRFLATPCLTQSYSFYVNEMLGIATYQPPEPPKPCSGGILGDAMGLGKTVMLMALILKSKQEQQRLMKGDNVSTQPKTTLVVAKLSLLPQWEYELQSKTNLTYKIFYGNNGKLINQTDLDDVDVVVTTYGVIQAEMKRKKSVVLEFDWLRVILDEAHCIRNQRTLASKACCQLKAMHRWCVSGTIIQNSLDDVFGIMKFLRHEPWCWPAFWKAAITSPVTNIPSSEDITEEEKKDEDQSLQIALDRVRRLLGPMMLRRTKDSLTKDGKPILTLPPVETRIIKVDFSDTEREFYNAVLARSLEVFDGFIESGTASSSYFQIFSMLQRLRQVCDHIALTVKTRIDEEGLHVAEDESTNQKSQKPAAKPKANDNEALGNEFLNGLLQKFCAKQQSPNSEKKRTGDDSTPSPKRAKDISYVSNVAHALSQAVEDNSTHIEEECAICLENPKIDQAVLTPCAHIFCEACLIGVLRAGASSEVTEKSSSKMLFCPDGKCPTCQEHVEAKRIIALSKSAGSDGNSMTTRYLTDTKVKASATSIKQEVRETEEGNPLAVARQILENAVSGTESSKMKAVMNELDNVWKQDPASKVLIFSHYLGYLDLFEGALRTNDIRFFRLDGSLKLKERMRVLDEFRSSEAGTLTKSKDDDITRGSVLLMSMSAGAEGLNIVAASSCFILEPWWNSAKEDQCVNRIHRIGQSAPLVRVRKFVVNDSVEERIVELQRKKAYVADEIYSDQGKVTDMESSRLSLDDFRLIFRTK